MPVSPWKYSWNGIMWCHVGSDWNFSWEPNTGRRPDGSSMNKETSLRARSLETSRSVAFWPLPRHDREQPGDPVVAQVVDGDALREFGPVLQEHLHAAGELRQASHGVRPQRGRRAQWDEPHDRSHPQRLIPAVRGVQDVLVEP